MPYTEHIYRIRAVNVCYQPVEQPAYNRNPSVHKWKRDNGRPIYNLRYELEGIAYNLAAHTNLEVILTCRMRMGSPWTSSEPFTGSLDGNGYEIATWWLIRQDKITQVYSAM